MVYTSGTGVDPCAFVRFVGCDVDDAVSIAVAVAKLETWLKTTGGRCEVVIEWRGVIDRCPVVRLHHPDGRTSTGCDTKDATVHAAITDALRWL